MTGIVAHNQLEVWLTMTGQVAQFVPEYSFLMLLLVSNIFIPSHNLKVVLSILIPSISWSILSIMELIEPPIQLK